ncbi:Putative ATPase [Candidatus Bealeia paramacronuclearis]|uniref:ATPase n=1 Tax=Candidatus Bealeia paramacronuclearis TaxID=1921001 RepID=A0ABZ2C581_9PROT|nr:putative ATPase [Candidatus Bealeia paramacronuclearis]
MSASTKSPYIIVLGNEKGGTGKSTLSMHLIMSLLHAGYKVGSIDVDARQGTLTRYVENRQSTQNAMSRQLPMPEHKSIHKSTNPSQPEAETEDEKHVMETFEALKNNDFIVVDTPGSDMYLSRLVHSRADTLITPLNDSFIDLDMLVRLKDGSVESSRPSTYAEMVWEQKKRRAIADGGSIDWIVLRNRLSSIKAKNKEHMEEVLSKLSKRLGFRYYPGFGERVIFRELFLSGLTLLDLEALGENMSISHVTARQELRSLLSMINLPELKTKIAV